MEIPFGKPELNEDESNSIKEVIKSGWLAHGPKTKEFEKGFADYCNAKFAVAVNSCAAALHLSLLATGIKEGDEVIVPAQTHVATSHTVIYAKARPVFADVELETYNISIDSINEKIGSRTKAIMPVHFAGQPCNMKEIYELAEDHNLHIIEDAAHAPGAEYNAQKIGSSEKSVSANFSFYPVKHITTAEGGMIVTNHDKIAEKARLLRAFGINKSTWLRTTTERPWFYKVNEIGFNYRMNEISAAMGIAQMKKIEDIHKKREENAKNYRNSLKNVDGLSVPACIDNVKQSYLFFQILINDKSKTKRDDLINKLREKGIGTSVHYPIPVPLMPIYRKLFNYKEGEFPNSEKIAKEAISLPLGPHINKEGIEYIYKSIIQLVER